MESRLSPSQALGRVRSGARIDVSAWSIAALVLVGHLLIAGRYDAFRNELYFIVCGRHPAFGYVDQPPLVPLIAALTQIAGDHVWLLRLPAAVAAALLVPVTVSLARLLGASSRGAWLAAIAAGTSPILIAVTCTFTTATFEPLTWTVVAYLVARALVRDERAMLILAGVVAGIAGEAKYGIAIWLIALIAGALCTPARRLFVIREFWLGAACCVAIVLPNLGWQAMQGFPFIEVVRNDNAGNLTGSPVGFAVGQLFAINILLAPLWLAGIVAPFLRGDLARFRFLSVAFAVAAILVYATHGKSYYLAAAYPTLFALGAAAWRGIAPTLAAAWLVLTIGNAALALPFVAPVLEPAALERYLSRAAVRPRPVEVAGIGAPLTQIFSDEFGWRELEHEVAGVYHALPPDQRRAAAILASNYGEAAALDVYGGHDQLPPALSEQDQYYLWGPRGYNGSIVIAVNADPERWKRICRASRTAAHFGVPYAMPYERERAIIVCQGARFPLALVWPRFKRYGL